MKKTAMAWFEGKKNPKEVEVISLPFMGGVRFFYKDGRVINYSANELVDLEV